MGMLKPFVLLACVAFTVGFVGYWALVGVMSPPAQPEAAAQWSSHADLPATPELVAGKHI